MVSKFQYDQTTDAYTCPQGETLKTTGHWHKKTTDRDSYEFKRYRTPKCRECPAKHLCTSRSAGRDIDRSQYADAVEENNKRYAENPTLPQASGNQRAYLWYDQTAMGL
ncbi:transposase [Flavobacterium gyeonganense]|uniref:Transposase n=1 Tax=Flavobacterium gyeonganense TaxID=1310418 RepID=A0ABV5HF30_9FLAO|nr:transposase [Flavobacterium gyeonganense]